MQIDKRASVANKMAILLLGLIVLELILISDHQVESVKSLKKKIYLKKLKKLIPILALLKPKKKILLLPIPIPMFKGQNQRPNNVNPGPNMMMRPTNQGAFMVVDPTPSQGASPPSSSMMMLDPTNMPAFDMMGGGVPPSAATMIPSMTMTISSADPGSPMSSIELNTNMLAPTGMMPQLPAAPSASQSMATTSSTPPSLSTGTGAMSAPLIQQPTMFYQPSPTKARLVRPIVTSGVQYASEPMIYDFAGAGRDCESHNSRGRLLGGGSGAANYPRRPFFSPAKLLRGSKTAPPSAPIIIAPTQPPPRKQAPLVTINHNWRPSPQSPAKLIQATQAPPVQQPIEQQHLEQHLEMEDLVSIGPPQLIPIYQTRNGRLHMTPPPSGQQTTTSATTSSSGAASPVNVGFDAEPASDDQNGEVRYINTTSNVFDHQSSNLKQNPASSTSTTTSSNLASGSVISSRPKSSLGGGGGY